MFPGQREASHRGRVECGGAPEPAGGGQPPHAGGGGHVRRVSGDCHVASRREDTGVEPAAGRRKLRLVSTLAIVVTK